MLKLGNTLELVITETTDNYEKISTITSSSFSDKRSFSRSSITLVIFNICCLCVSTNLLCLSASCASDSRELRATLNFLSVVSLQYQFLTKKEK